MAVTVGVNFLSVVHKDSGGTTIAFPDVCMVPAPPGQPVPIPYPNTATTALKSQQKKAVKVAGAAVGVAGSHFKTATGDEPGTVKGIVSQKSPSSLVSYSFDVKVEGSSVAMMEQIQLQNGLNQANARLQAMRTRDPKEWQRALTEYAVLASALYRTLYPDD